MKHLTLILLLALAPLSWGEDVYYCVEEKKLALGPVLDDGELFQTELNPKKFTLKYEPENNRLALKGSGWSSNERPYYLECVFCEPDAILQAQDEIVNLSLTGTRFYYAEATSDFARMATGTCTKF